MSILRQVFTARWQNNCTPMRTMPKVLIGTPTYEGKNYCLKQFIDNVRSFTYPSKFVDFVIFDNSNTPENAKYISKELGVKVVWKDYSDMGVIKKLFFTHEDIRLYAINNKYDYLLHLESDLFPPEDLIEQLLWTRKDIVGVPYQLYGGGQRKPITTGYDHREMYPDVYIGGLNIGFVHHYFFDGTVKRCTTNGIGCTLFKVNTIRNVPFRYVEGDDSAPDTWFTQDLLHHKLPYYVHTGLLAFHWNNEDWGKYAHMIQYDKTE